MKGRALAVRAAVYALVLPWIGVCLSHTPHGAMLWTGGVVLLGAGFTAVGLTRPRWIEGRWFRAVEISLWNLVLAVLLGEALVRTYIAVGDPPPWFTPEPDHRAYRLDPAYDYLGTRPNSQGFYDTEFRALREPGVVRVVALGDSYTVGMVPYAENYLTLVDRGLGDGVELLNLGVVHTAVPEYLEVLRADGLALAPDLVLLSLYVGNDIQPDEPSGLFSRSGCRLLVAIRTLVAVTSGSGTAPINRSGAGLFREGPNGERIEVPIMSVEKHMAREWKHLEWLFGPPAEDRMERAWRDTEAAIDALLALCRERGIPLVATIAPDEIQVVGPLFDTVIAAHDASPGAFDLSYPNARLAGHLVKLGVPTLDLTPALRRAEASGPTYHPRAVHWNRHGNAAVAAALQPWLEARIDALGLR